jgi:hypothetical protein
MSDYQLDLNRIVAELNRMSAQKPADRSTSPPTGARRTIRSYSLWRFVRAPRIFCSLPARQ